MKRCSKCGKMKDHTDFNNNRRTKDGLYSYCRKCDNGVAKKRYIACGHITMSENKACSSYLGVAVAERLCRHLFKDVIRMRNGNPGYDFICNRNKKIDVKSACITLNLKKHPHWHFAINRNQIADFFLLVAFDNRDNLEPLHQWLIPSDKLNKQVKASIFPSTIDKWDAWRQPIGPAVECCNSLIKVKF